MIGSIKCILYEIKNKSNKYYCKLSKEDAKNILLAYYKDVDITEGMLIIYPESKEELDKINQILDGSNEYFQGINDISFLMNKNPYVSSR